MTEAARTRLRVPVAYTISSAARVVLRHGVIDLHCHILPGIDDGPQTIEQSLALARAAAASGTRTVVATPHVSWQYRNDPSTIAQLVEAVGERLRAEHIGVELRGGAEIAMTIVGDLDARQLAAHALGGGRWLLIEPPFTLVASGLDLLIADLQQRGHRVVLAHPERCQAFHRDRRLLEAQVAAGALVSITAGSLVGQFGGRVRRFALELVRDELVHNVSSDAHNAAGRPPGTAAAINAAGLAPLSEWLTQAVPAAILDGKQIPPRPSVAPGDVGGRRGGILRRALWRG